MKYCVLICVVTTVTQLAVPAFAVKLIDCPKGAPKGYVVLKSNQNKCVQLKTEVAKQSRSLSAMIEDLGGDTSEIIPMNLMGNSQLKDIGTLMDESFEQSDDVIMTKLKTIMTNNQYDLVQILKSANYLDIAVILNSGLDVFSKKLLEEDLPKLLTRNAAGYASYKKGVLQSLPADLTRLMLQRNRSLLPPIVVATSDVSSSASTVAASKDGKYFLTGDQRGEAKLFDANARGNLKPIAILKPHDFGVIAAAFSPDGKLILTASNKGTAYLWDANVRGNDAKPLTPFRRENNGLRAAYFSPDGKYILTHADSGNASLWDATARGDNAKPFITWQHKGLRQIGFAMGSKTLWTAEAENEKITVRFWDATASGENPKPLKTLDLVESEGIRFSSNGKTFLTWSSNTSKLWEIDAEGEAKQRATFLSGTALYSVSFSPDDKYILIVPVSGVVEIWDASVKGDNTEPLVKLKVDFKDKSRLHPLKVAQSSYGKTVMIATDEETALWDVGYVDYLSLPAAQIALLARQKKLAADKLPKHLVNELNGREKDLLPKK